MRKAFIVFLLFFITLSAFAYRKSSSFSETGTTIYPNSIDDNVMIGGQSGTISGKGVLVLKANETPTSAPEGCIALYAKSTGVDGSNGSLLLNFEGDNGDTSTTDESDNGNVVTFVGSSSISTVEKKFGASSLYLVGLDDYLTIPDSDIWDVCGSLSDSWTIDLWVKHIDGNWASTYIKQDGVGYADGWFLTHDPTNGFHFNASVNGVITYVNLQEYAGFRISDTDWHHVAVIKSGSDWGLYVDGVQKLYYEQTNIGTFAGDISIGDGTSFDHGGYIDGLKIENTNSFNAIPKEDLSDTITIPTSAYLSEASEISLEAIDEDGEDALGGVSTASDVSTTTTSFNNNLSSTDDTVQKALDTLDDVASGSGDSISIDSVAVVDPDFVSTGDIDFVNTSNTITASINADSVSADELNATGVEAELEAVLDLEELQGAVVDSQVPDNITITESDPNALLMAGIDNIKDTHIDWGLGAGQVSTLDITEGTNKKFISDAQLVVVGNTSGTNTGDNTGTDTLDDLSDNSTTDLSEGTNLYYTEARVSANSSVSANTAKNTYPSADATKLSGIATGAEVNVQSDWDATSGDAQTLNKPSLSSGGTYYQILSVQSAKLTGSDITNSARIDAGDRGWRLLFDDTTQQESVWQFVVDPNYAGGTMTLEILFSMKDAQTGDKDVKFDAKFMSVTATDSIDWNTDGYDSEQTVTVSLANAQPAGYVRKATITFTKTQADEMEIDDIVRIHLERDPTVTDDATEDVEILGVCLHE